MNENILREIIEAELLVDDNLCINGCGSVEFEKPCSHCGLIQDLELRSDIGRVEGIIDVYSLVVS